MSALQADCRIAGAAQFAVQPRRGWASLKSDPFERVAEVLQHSNDRCGLRLDLLLQKDVAGSVDDADADGFERYVEAGEIVHDPLPCFVCRQTSGDIALAWSPAYSIFAGWDWKAVSPITRPSPRPVMAGSAAVTLSAAYSRWWYSARWLRAWSVVKASPSTPV